MRPIPTIAILAVMSAGFAAEGDAKPKPQTLEWCTVSTPAKVTPGSACEITVTLTKLPDDAKFVTVDLHARGEGGEYKGFYASGGAKPATKDTPITWKIGTKAKDGVIEIVPLIYLSTAGNWNTKTLGENSEPIALQ